MKKQLPTAGIRSELAQSVFFPKPGGEQSNEGGSRATPSKLPPPIQAKPLISPALSSHEGENQKGNNSSKQDGMIDVMTSSHHDVSLKEWQEVIENTETQSSALRLTSEERYAVEDAVSELRRKYGIKTSMNEVARLGLLLLIADFKQNKKESMIHKVKKA